MDPTIVKGWVHVGSPPPPPPPPPPSREEHGNQIQKRHPGGGGDCILDNHPSFCLIIPQFRLQSSMFYLVQDKFLPHFMGGDKGSNHIPANLTKLCVISVHKNGFIA